MMAAPAAFIQLSSLSLHLLFDAMKSGFVFGCILNQRAEGVEGKAGKEAHKNAANQAADADHNKLPILPVVQLAGCFVFQSQTRDDKDDGGNNACKYEEPEVDLCEYLNLFPGVLEHESSSYPFAQSAILIAIIATCSTKSKYR